MTAVRAAFSDFRTVKSRKVAQLIMEIPIEQANAALAALGGVPQFATEQWVGIAPLTDEAASQPATERKEMTRAQWAGMLCQDEQFQRFVSTQEGWYLMPGMFGTETATAWAADFVREYCGVTSRSMIDGEASGAAAEKWDILKTEYDAWRGRIARP